MKKMAITSYNLFLVKLVSIIPRSYDMNPYNMYAVIG